MKRFHFLCLGMMLCGAATAQTINQGSFEAASAFGMCGATADQLQGSVLGGLTADFAVSGTGVICYTDGTQSFDYGQSAVCSGQAPSPTNGAFAMGMGNNVTIALRLSGNLVAGNCYTVTFDVRNKNQPGQSNCNFPGKLAFGISSSASAFGTAVVTMASDVAPSTTWATGQQVSFTVPSGSTGNNYLTFRLANQADGNAFLFVDNLNLTPCTALPIRLRSFKATGMPERRVRLDWKTADARDFDHFEVERGKTPQLLQVIGRVDKKADAIGHYTYEDQSPKPGVAFYRLKMVDIDGRASYSGVAEVATAGDAAVRVFPNPVQTQLNVQLPAELSGSPVRFVLFNPLGQVVLNRLVSQVSSTETLSLPKSLLPDGVYLLKIQGMASSFAAYQKVILHNQ